MGTLIRLASSSGVRSSTVWPFRSAASSCLTISRIFSKNGSNSLIYPQIVGLSTEKFFLKFTNLGPRATTLLPSVAFKSPSPRSSSLNRATERVAIHNESDCAARITRGRLRNPARMHKRRCCFCRLVAAVQFSTFVSHHTQQVFQRRHSSYHRFMPFSYAMVLIPAPDFSSATFRESFWSWHISNFHLIFRYARYSK